MPDFGIFRGFNDKLFGDKLYAGQLPTQLGNITFSGILDFYPSAAGAYSLRKLRNAYSSFAIRVRRSSDNTEQNIGFTTTGLLDTSALTSFCGSGNGFVTTWYDQSGNSRNATQTTAAYQPQIVSNGNVLLFNSKPKMTTGINGYFSINRISHSDFTIISVAGNNGTSNNKRITGGGVGVSGTNLRYDNTNKAQLTDGTIILITSTNTAPTATNLIIGIAKSNGSEISLNGNMQSNSTVRNLSAIDYLFAQNANVEFLNSDVCEVIIYSSDQSFNRTGIESNINTYYGIY